MSDRVPAGKEKGKGRGPNAGQNRKVLGGGVWEERGRLLERGEGRCNVGRTTGGGRERACWGGLRFRHSQDRREGSQMCGGKKAEGKDGKRAA